MLNGLTLKIIIITLNIDRSRRLSKQRDKSSPVGGGALWRSRTPGDKSRISMPVGSKITTYGSRKCQFLEDSTQNLIDHGESKQDSIRMLNSCASMPMPLHKANLGPGRRTHTALLWSSKGSNEKRGIQNTNTTRIDVFSRKR